MPDSKESKEHQVHQRKARELSTALKEKDWKKLHKLLGQGVASDSRKGKAYQALLLAKDFLPKRWLRLFYADFFNLVDDDASDFENLGHLWFGLECSLEAEQSYRRALVLQPASLPSLVGLANCLVMNSRLTEARRLLESARLLTPENPEVLSLLGDIYLNQNETEEALACFQLAEEQGGPDSWRHGVSFLRGLAYLSDVTAEDLKEAGQEWEARHAPPLEKSPRRKGGGKMRIGYYSPDFRNHSISYFLRPILREHDRSQFEIFLYSDTRFCDSVTEEIRGHGDHWRDLASSKDDQAVERIRKDQLDILIELAGYFGDVRPRIFAARPAPAQAHLLGYNGTTGLSALDYRFSDPVSDPPECDHESSEKVIRLDPGFHCFEQEPGLELSEGEAPCSVVPHVTFGSFNSSPKLNDEVVALWSEILLAVPQSRLLIKSITLGDWESRELLVKRFCAQGVAPERIDILPGSATKMEHLRLYRRVDIALDPFPVNGTTTTCEALWMGVPVLSLLGQRHSARVSASLLRQIGLEEGVAKTPEEYLRRAAEWASNREQIVRWRQSLRAMMSDSPVGQAKDYVRKLEDVYREVISAE